VLGARCYVRVQVLGAEQVPRCWVLGAGLGSTCSEAFESDAVSIGRLDVWSVTSAPGTRTCTRHRAP